MPPSDLAQELDAMARDFAAMVRGGRDSSDRRVGMAQEGSGVFARQPGGATVREFPRPSRPVDISDRYRSNQSASDRTWIGRLTSRTPAGLKAALPMVMNSLQRLRPQSHSLDIPLRAIVSVFVAALMGVGAIFVWQSHGISIANSPDVVVTAGQAVLTRADQVSAASPQPAPITQTEPAPAAATSPELELQLETIVRDLAVLRDSVEQLTAKQEQTSQKVTTLQAIAAKQEQMAQNIARLQALAAKQEEMAQDITMLQAADEDISQRLSSPPVSQPVPLPHSKKPSVAPKRSAAPSASAPRLAPVGLPFLQGSP
jgi:hypothetical protein